MKALVVCFWMLWGVVANAQSFGLRVGRNLTPADYFSLRYEHWTNGVLNFSLAGFAQRSRSHAMNYSCYGMDLLTEYASSRNRDALPVFGWRAGLGAAFQVEKDPWVNKALSTGYPINYGIVAELSGEWYMTEVFLLSLFAQQKLLMRSSLGSRQACFSIGLNYQFPSY